MGHGGSDDFTTLFSHPDVLGRRCISDGGEAAFGIPRNRGVARQGTIGTLQSQLCQLLGDVACRFMPGLRTLFCLLPRDLSYQVPDRICTDGTDLHRAVREIPCSFDVTGIVRTETVEFVKVKRRDIVVCWV